MEQLVEEQKNIIAKLELKLIRSQDYFNQMKQKHIEINNQIVQANVSFQQSITEANRTIRLLRQEKDDLQIELAQERANSSTLEARISGLESANTVLSTINDKLIKSINASSTMDDVLKDDEFPIPMNPHEDSYSNLDKSEEICISPGYVSPPRNAIHSPIPKNLKDLSNTIVSISEKKKGNKKKSRKDKVENEKIDDIKENCANEVKSYSISKTIVKNRKTRHTHSGVNYKEPSLRDKMRRGK